MQGVTGEPGVGERSGEGDGLGEDGGGRGARRCGEERGGDGVLGAVAEQELFGGKLEARAGDPVGDDAAVACMAAGRPVVGEAAGVDASAHGVEGGADRRVAEEGRRHVRREVDAILRRARAVGGEGALAVRATHEAAAFEGGVGLRHGADGDAELAGERAMGRQPCPRGDASVDEVFGERGRQPFRGRSTGRGEPRRPRRGFAHLRLPGVL